MAKFVKQTSDLAESLNRLQGFAENLISMETNRRIQLGREKEARMTDAYQYMLNNENEEIADLEAGLDLIEQNLMTRGVELKSVKDEYKTIASEELLAAANEGAVELLNVKLEDSRGHRDSLQERKSKAMEIKRSIDLFDDALALADPSLFGDPDLVEAGDIAKAIENLGIESENFQDEVEDYIKFRQSPEQLAISQEGWLDKLKQEIETGTVTRGAEHSDSIGAIQSLEMPRQQIVETLKMKTQDPAIVLARHFGPMGVLKQQIADEDNTTKKAALQTQLEEAYSDLGSILYPQLMNAEGGWAEPTPELQAKLAQDLGISLSLLKEGDPTEFVAYLEHAQSYYNEMKQDQTEVGEASSNRIRQEVLALLGIDLEVPIKFGDEIMSPIDLILAHYNELERIELEQSFHGIKISKSIEPNVIFDTSYPESENTKANSFMKSKRKQ